MKKKNLFLAAFATICIAIATMAQVPNYVPTNGLVGWWPFNGNANDGSGNGNNGTVNGAILTTDRFGSANKAYSFDGVNDYIKTLSSSSLQPANAISFMAWINPQGTGGYPHILTKNYGVGTNSYAMTYKIPAQNFRAVFNSLTTGSVISPNLVQSSTWSHLVCTYDGSEIKLFENGILVDSAMVSNILNYSNNPLLFAASNDPTTQSGVVYLNGKLDDIAIWNRALTQQEVSDLYNGNICYQYVTVTDTLIINTNITGFNPITYQNKIMVWPNPTNDHITIDYGNFATLNGYQLKITNSLGQQMFQTTINQQQSYLDLSTWTGNGIYIAYILDSQGNIIDIKKIVLQ